MGAEMRMLLSAVITALGLTSTVRKDQDYATLLREGKISLAQAVELGVKASKTPRIALARAGCARCGPRRSRRADAGTWLPPSASLSHL
jgi:hypothetical protein